MLFNLHTHTHFSDGSSAPEKYIEEALRQGFHTLGFSDHSPVPFNNNFAIKEERMEEYINTKRLLEDSTPNPSPSMAEAKEGGLTILLSLEIDYIPGITKPIDDYRQMGCFDYFIGSVHLVKNGDSNDLWFIDGPEISIYDQGLLRVFHGDIRKAVTSYYHQINEMLESQRPEIVGHLDKIRMYNRNRYFSEDDGWYKDLVDETLRVIKETETVVEVNTRGLYKKRSDALFPGIEILKKIHALKIPVLISSDAPKPEELSYGFDGAKNVLLEIGFENVAMKTVSGWTNISLR